MTNNKFYVTMTDKFLSGWGMANGKINKLVISCASQKEANIVYDNAVNRGEMKYVNIVMKKPYYPPKQYYVSWHNRSTYGS